MRRLTIAIAVIALAGSTLACTPAEDGGDEDEAAASTSEKAEADEGDEDE